MTDVGNEATADSGADLAPGTNVAGYVIDGKLGEGGMGVVYGAKQPRIGKRVAIKILARAYCGDPEVVARFEQEARVVNEIKHPNIVDVFQFGELADKRSFFVMEWLDGEALTARIDRGAIPQAEAIEILDVISDALQAAHEHNVIHRDLKSDNVYLVTSRGKRTVKLLDFGLAKLSGKGLEDAPVGSTKQGIVVGTPAYMSPEQARSKPVDGRTDIYALGVLAYKMLTGTLPFRGESSMDLIVQQLNAPPPQAIKLAPKTAPALSRMIVKMMAKAPEDRPTLLQIRALFAELRGDGEGIPRRAKRTTRQPEPAVDANQPYGGKVRMAVEDMEASPDQHDAPASSRATPILLAAAALLAIVIVTVVVLLVKKSGTSAAPAPAAIGSAGSADLSAAAAGSAGSDGSAGSAAAIAPTPAPTIEFEDDKVVKTGSAATVRKRPDTDTTKEPEITPTIVSRKPGRIVIMLQHPSTIEIDGKVVSQNTAGGQFDVLPGEHQIKILAPDRSAVNRSITVDPGGSAVIRIVDDTDEPAAPAPAPAPAPAAPVPTAPSPEATP